MRVRNLSRDHIVAEPVFRAGTFFTRLLGALPRSVLEPGEGVWIVPCRWIHTWGMRRGVEALFLDREGVVRRIERLLPNRVSARVAAARTVLEVGEGTLARRVCRPGDRLQLEA